MSKMSYNEKSDIWSLGCLLYELCALHPPFLAMDQRSLAVKIRDGRFKPIPSHFSSELSEFIKWMLQVDVSFAFCSMHTLFFCSLSTIHHHRLESIN